MRMNFPSFPVPTLTFHSATHFPPVTVTRLFSRLSYIFSVARIGVHALTVFYEYSPQNVVSL